LSNLPELFPLYDRLLPLDPTEIPGIFTDRRFCELDWDIYRVALAMVKEQNEALGEAAGPAEIANLGLLEYLDLYRYDRVSESEEEKYVWLCITQRNRIQAEIMEHFRRWTDGSEYIERIFDPIREQLAWGLSTIELRAFDQRLERVMDRVYSEVEGPDSYLTIPLWEHAAKLTTSP
jgi:hypothetical protein